jgi:hypothetical protein
VTAALDRLEASRARLREAMRPAAPAPPRGRPENAGRSWLQGLRALPIISLVADALHGWWLQNPLRPVALVAAEASNAVARPLAQRHPIALMLVAGTAGAALSWARPWRWALRSALLAGLVPQLASRVVDKLPIESWLTLLSAALSKAEAQPRPQDTARRGDPDVSFPGQGDL